MADDPLKSLEQQIALKEASLASQMKINDLIDKSVETHGKITQETQNLIAAEEEIVALKEQQLDLTEKTANAVDSSNKAMQLGSMILGGMIAAAEKLVGSWESFQGGVASTRDLLGVNTDQAKELQGQFLDLAAASGDIWSTTPMAQVSAAEIATSFAALESSFSNLSMISPAFAAENAITAKKLGISAEQSAKLRSEFMLLDGMSESTSKHTMFLFKNLADASKVNFGSVMADVEKSGKAFANYTGKSMKDTVKMAIEMRKMGFELSDAVDMADALLDVEGRIEKQMKFNMMTGKNINLDKATQLALEGDLVGAQKEIMDAVGETKDLGIMERKVLDDLLGGKLQQIEMADELAARAEADKAAEEEAAALLEEKNAKAAEERALELEHAATTATNLEMMNAGQDTLNQKLGEMLDKRNEDNNLMKFYQNTMLAIQGITLGIKLMEIAISKEKVKQFASYAKEKAAKGVSLMMDIGRAAMSAMSSLSAIPIVGWALGLAAAGAAVAFGMKYMKDGVIGPGGETVVSGPKGSIQLDKQDSMIVGTNLMGNKGGGGNASNEALLAKMDQLISAVKANRQLNVDGYSMNEALHLEKIPSGMA